MEADTDVARYLGRPARRVPAKAWWTSRTIWAASAALIVSVYTWWFDGGWRPPDPGQVMEWMAILGVYPARWVAQRPLGGGR